jgi:hypothetical protein
MYGIVNNAIEELVTDKFSAEVWNAVKIKSGIKVDFIQGLSKFFDDPVAIEIVECRLNNNHHEIFKSAGYKI